MIPAEVFAAEWTFKWKTNVLVAVMALQVLINFFSSFYVCKMMIGNLNI